MSQAEQTQSDLQWFAVTVNPKSEFVTAAALQRKGLGSFLPTYQARHTWSDRNKELNLPLFPGYIFCRFGRLQRTLVLQTPGARSVVSFGGVPAPVPDREIEYLKKALEAGVLASPCDFIEVGRAVRIRDGALEGVEGILVGTKKDCRLILSVTLLQRSVSLVLDACLVSPLPQRSVRSTTGTLAAKAG
jgi:transcription antitermination factor NusG